EEHPLENKTGEHEREGVEKVRDDHDPGNSEHSVLVGTPLEQRLDQLDAGKSLLNEDDEDGVERERAKYGEDGQRQKPHLDVRSEVHTRRKQRQSVRALARNLTSK